MLYYFIKDKTVEVDIEKEKTAKVLEELVVEQAAVAEDEEKVSVATAEANEKKRMAKIESDEAEEALAEAIPIKEKAKREAENIYKLPVPLSFEDQKREKIDLYIRESANCLYDF